MRKLKSLLLVLCAIELLTVSVTGCAQKGYVQTGRAQNIDCRSCHTSSGTGDVMDFSQIYAESSSHHPVGVKYPVGLNIKPNFSQPSGQSAGVMFFDRNGNGQPDNDEIQMFGEGGFATVECSSCHKEHGNTPAPADATRNGYLRFDNADSGMCTTCHSY